MSIEDIDRKIVYNTQCELNVLDVAFIDASAQNLEDIKVKLPSKYQNFLDVFDRAQADKLSSHRSYDHKIELTNDVTLQASEDQRISERKSVKEFYYF